MQDLSTAPANWPQRVRRGIPFPPGIDGARFSIINTADGGIWHLNQHTGEVFFAAFGHFDAPPWNELPDIVREQVRAALSARDR